MGRGGYSVTFCINGEGFCLNDLLLLLIDFKAGL